MDSLFQIVVSLLLYLLLPHPVFVSAEATIQARVPPRPPGLPERQAMHCAPSKVPPIEVFPGSAKSLHHTYTTLTDLCEAGPLISTDHVELGCTCWVGEKTPGCARSPKFHFHSPDRRLAYQDLLRQFKTTCLRQCYCGAYDEDKSAHLEQLATSLIDQLPLQRTGNPIDLRRCGSGCSNNRDCGSSRSDSWASSSGSYRGRDCRCVATARRQGAATAGRSYFDIVEGLGIAGTAFQASCRTLPFNYGKRHVGSEELDFGCACNRTYVSPGCCDSFDGIIQEPESVRQQWLKRTAILP